MRTGRCPHYCPHTWYVFDPVRTPHHLKVLRALAFLTALVLFLLTLRFLPIDGAVAVAFGLASLFALLTGFGQTAILRSLGEHPGHERRQP